MENKELYEISNFRIFTSIAATLFLLILVSRVFPDYLKGPISNVFWIFVIVVIVFLFNIILYSFFRVKDLPDELNNLLALFVIGAAYLLLEVLGFV